MPTAYFLLNVTLNYEQETIQKIKNILEKEKSISFDLQGVYGIYDIIIKISSESDEKIRHVALEKIRAIDKIQSAITMMVNEDYE